MKVHEMIKLLSSIPNQEAEVKIIAGTDLYDASDVWTNSQPVIIEGKRNE